MFLNMLKISALAAWPAIQQHKGGRGGEGRGGQKVPTAYNSKTIHGIEMKCGRVVENHKLINLLYFNWQMT